MPPETSKVPERFAPGTFDTVITDLPYASGGRTQAEKINLSPIGVSSL